MHTSNAHLSFGVAPCPLRRGHSLANTRVRLLDTTLRRSSRRLQPRSSASLGAHPVLPQLSDNDAAELRGLRAPSAQAQRVICCACTLLLGEGATRRGSAPLGSVSLVCAPPAALLPWDEARHVLRRADFKDAFNFFRPPQGGLPPHLAAEIRRSLWGSARGGAALPAAAARLRDESAHARAKAYGWGASGTPSHLYRPAAPVSAADAAHAGAAVAVLHTWCLAVLAACRRDLELAASAASASATAPVGASLAPASIGLGCFQSEPMYACFSADASAVLERSRVVAEQRRALAEAEGGIRNAIPCRWGSARVAHVLGRS